ncbi:MAG: hypothetical protein H6Q14_2939 [Bacteroidetes bacterium]|nr:hypothetical protein [Bacteroidota bacterium]
MKKSISYLPKRKQEDLIFLVREINKRLPQAQLVILYGSYATGKFVEHDERIEFGIPTSFMSDYDILVVTSGISDKKVGNVLDNIDDLYYKDPEHQTPVQFINDDIKTLNRQLEEGRYFYTQVKQEGIVLYDSGKFKLARRRKLNFKEIQQQAQEYFDEKFTNANGFLDVTEFCYSKKNYKLASFQLHQATENFYYSIRLAFTLRNNKQHNLAKLSASVKGHSEELANVFPRDTAEEKRLFTLLKDAYVEARYNPDFVVTKEDIEALLPKVELLRDITKRICDGKIREYGDME